MTFEVLVSAALRLLQVVGSACPELQRAAAGQIKLLEIIFSIQLSEQIHEKSC